jgi:outer membrane protein assembly factor BamA
MSPMRFRTLERFCALALSAASPLVIAAFLAAPAALRAQSSPAPVTYRLAGLKFNGLVKITEAQMTAFTGLKQNSKITADDLLTIQKKLSKSGAFDEVAYNYKTNGPDLSVIYDLTESKDLAPCVYDNFIWFTSAELDATLRSRLPLYNGVVPVRGTLLDDAVAALETLVHTKAPSAKVEYSSLGEVARDGTSAVTFRITGVSMPLQSVTFIGATAVPEKDLEATLNDAFGQDYSASRLSDIASKGLTALFHNKGYWRVKISSISPMLASAPADASNSSFPVGAAITIDEGQPYNWAKAIWIGNHAIPTDQLDKSIRVQPNEIADEYKIEAGLNSIRLAYLTRGFLDMNVRPEMKLDDATHLATDEVSITEGPQYHMGTLQFLGVPPRAAEALAKKWTLKTGDPFDSTYSQKFIDTIAGREVAAQGIRVARVSTRQQIDRQAHVVSLTLVFQ